MAFRSQLPWVKEPLICAAPMRLICLAELACAVSLSGGLGFIGAGNDTSTLESMLQNAQKLLEPITERSRDLLPVGVGFLNWGADLAHAAELVARYRPCAIWFFAARKNEDMLEWTTTIREACPDTAIWIQVSTVQTAVELVQLCHPDVLVVQGTDAGGHGLTLAGGSLITLLPEVIDALGRLNLEQQFPKIVGAGGVIDGRGAAAAMTLGAEGVVLGTAYLASEEAVLASGYRKAVLESSDGGITTVRSSVYDELRGTTDWPSGYGGRAIINQSYVDAQGGMRFEDNKKMYDVALADGDKGWGVQGRLTTYAGTGIGLVRETQPAAAITKSVREGALRTLQKTNQAFSSIAL